MFLWWRLYEYICKYVKEAHQGPAKDGIYPVAEVAYLSHKLQKSSSSSLYFSCKGAYSQFLHPLLHLLLLLHVQPRS